MLGLQEELGELAHALLKQRQGIRGTEGKHEEAAKDAVGDIMIYMMDLCNKRGWNLQDIIETTWEVVRIRNWQANPETGQLGTPEPLSEALEAASAGPIGIQDEYVNLCAPGTCESCDNRRKLMGRLGRANPGFVHKVCS